MRRLFPIMLLAPLAFGAVPAFAKGYYSATPAAQPAENSYVTRNVVWRCEGGTCTAPKAGTRDAVVCELVAKQVGTLAGFSANGTAFDEAALTKCNARAK